MPRVVVNCLILRQKISIQNFTAQYGSHKPHVANEQASTSNQDELNTHQIAKPQSQKNVKCHVNKFILITCRDNILAILGLMKQMAKINFPSFFFFFYFFNVATWNFQITCVACMCGSHHISIGWCRSRRCLAHKKQSINIYRMKTTHIAIII